MNQAPTQNNIASIATNLDVKEQAFLTEAENEGVAQRGVPLAGKFKVTRIINGSAQEIEVNAIGEYKIPENEGTFVLASVDGVIQWLATENCDEDQE